MASNPRPIQHSALPGGLLLQEQQARVPCVVAGMKESNPEQSPFSQNQDHFHPAAPAASTSAKDGQRDTAESFHPSQIPAGAPDLLHQHPQTVPDGNQPRVSEAPGPEDGDAGEENEDERMERLHPWLEEEREEIHEAQDAMMEEEEDEEDEEEEYEEEYEEEDAQEEEDEDE